jgi:hypothetical protein
VVDDGTEIVHLQRWTGPWEPDDRDANFKSDVALYSHTDPMVGITGLSHRTGIPTGALVRYVLARWTSAGSASLLELGPHVVERMWAMVETAEEAGDDEARLEAYEQLRQVLSWLRLPLVSDVRYADPPGPGRSDDH